VGIVVGDAVGADVGAAVGLPVGLMVGEAVGFGEGVGSDDVGTGVGVTGKRRKGLDQMMRTISVTSGKV
jgi:hypothetical protein